MDHPDLRWDCVATAARRYVQSTVTLWLVVIVDYNSFLQEYKVSEFHGFQVCPGFCRKKLENQIAKGEVRKTEPGPNEGQNISTSR